MFDVPFILHSPFSILVLLLLFLSSTASASAATRYVWQDSPSAGPPYTNWATAAHVIQDAVNAALAGDEIVVTNGTYATGGRTVGTNVLVNRVAVEKPLALRSVKGPQFTIIQGYEVPGATNGDGAIRCVYLTNGASLSGFTLTKGATRHWIGTGNRDEREYNGGGVWCESTSAVASNCVLVGNSADVHGGGAYQGTLNNCTLTGNSAGAGGGACGGTLNNCTLTGNSAASSGGGVASSTLNNCTLTGNSASYGGGAIASGLNNCIVYFNIAADRPNYGGEGDQSSLLNYCCTTPQPEPWGGGGIGNTTLDPQLASATYLSATSPCRGAGSAAYASGTDIDGEAWATPPSIGCDEYHAEEVTGPLKVSIAAAFTNVAVGFPVELTALIEGRTTASAWNFGDGGVMSNRPYTSHAWTAPGDYAVVLRAYNGNHPEGVSATVTVHVVEIVHYVAVGNTNPVSPYTSWATAARNIQDAVDVASTTGALVLVTNGTYATGGRAVVGTMTNRVAVDKPLTLRSVNGPEFTVIQGYQVPGTTTGNGAIRCVYLAKGASLSGFTLTSGATRTDGDWQQEQSGGGLWCESQAAAVSNCLVTGNSASSGGGARRATLNNCTLASNTATDYGGGAAESTLNNCTLSGNSASSGGGASGGTLNNCVLTGNSAEYGGGVDGGTLNNCTLAGNSAGDSGAGADWGTLNNCTLTGNSAASYGGGARSSTLNNCVVYFNRAPNGANYWESAFTYSCTTPLPLGVGNIDADPQLASITHLSPISPCIGTGSPAYATGVDIDGEPWASPPAMGADQPGPVTGLLSLWIDAGFTNVVPGYTVSFTARNAGAILKNVWDFGDGTVLTNQPFATHAWSAPGLYTVRLTGYNGSYPGGVTTTVAVTVREAMSYVNLASAHPVSPYGSWETAARTIQDVIGAGPAGRLVLVTNGVYRVGTVENNGLNRVVLTNGLAVRSVNGPMVTVIEGATSEVRCAYVGSGAVLSGFTLTKGATPPGDRAIGRGGGVFCESFGVVTNCVLTDNSAENGGGAYGGTLNNCTLAGNSAGDSGGGALNSTLNNCTLTDNSAQSGGGVAWSTLNNCVLSVNSAGWIGGGAYEGTLNNCTIKSNSVTVNPALGLGGGVAWSTLNNCVLSANSAATEGGGAYFGTLNNCTLTANSARIGGGTIGGTLNNCIVYFNTAPGEPNYAQCGRLNCCCTTPLPEAWQRILGNIANAPLFVDYAAGNLRLQSNSPCINAGRNAYAPGLTDLDGLPRIVSGTVDIGAYEFQGPGSVISYAWLQQYGLPTDGSADYTDSDHDGMNNWQEWRCLTDPTNALSALRLLSASPDGTNVTVTWQSVEGVSYFLERSMDLSATPRFRRLATNLPGQLGTATFTDTDAAAAPHLFYRLGVGY